MRPTKRLLAGLVAIGLASGGYLYAQPTGGTPSADVTASGETKADLSPREMQTESKKLLTDMETIHVRVLALQTAARKAKDVIKLNCVNEKLLAVKQLLNIGDQAENDLTEAISASDRDAEVHQYSQVKLADERAVAERDEAEGCIGEEIVFIGPTQVTTSGPPIPDDPTHGPSPFDAPLDIEHVDMASPWY
jgi:hypothetical protein